MTVVPGMGEDGEEGGVAWGWAGWQRKFANHPGQTSTLQVASGNDLTGWHN